MGGILAVKICPAHRPMGTEKQALAISSSPLTWLLGVELGSGWPEATISFSTLAMPVVAADSVTDNVTLCPTDSVPIVHWPVVATKPPAEANDDITG